MEIAATALAHAPVAEARVILTGIFDQLFGAMRLTQFAPQPRNIATPHL
jgi:hypothetical protein